MLAALPYLVAAVMAAPNSFHFIKIKEIYAGSEAFPGPQVQYVVLQMYAPGQTEVSGKQVRYFSRNGTLLDTFTFSANVPNGLDQSTILVGYTQVNTFFNVTVNLAVNPIMDPMGGKVCFHDPVAVGDIDCVSWGSYTGNSGGVGTPLNDPIGIERGVAWRRRLDICGSPTILDSCDDTDNSASDFIAALPAPRNNAGTNGTIPSSICGNSIVQSLEQCDDGNLGGGDGCSALCRREATAMAPFGLQPFTTTVPDNGVIEPGEGNWLGTRWRNQTPATTLSWTASLTKLTGPPGAGYSIPFPGIAYDNVAPGSVAPCSNCPAIGVSDPTPRPATHWDAVATEVNSFYGFKTWTVHIARSFVDVPPANPFYKFVETLLHKGVTGGCTATNYCPANRTTREQMAAFVLVAKEGPAYSPAACVAGAEQFADVPASSAFCRWIEELANRGVVAGCGGGNYCPGSPVSRDQMAVFVLRTLDPVLNPPACVAGAEMFADVPAGSPFCKWIEELANRAVVSGCGGGNYCPGGLVTREQMGVFLGVTFGLALYGP